MTKEQPRAICSGRSKQKSDCERFAKATLLLRVTWANLSCHSQKREIHFKKFKKNFFSYFLTVFPPFYVKERIAPFALRSVALFLKIDHERIAQVNLIKKTTLSDLLPLLFIKERREGFTFFPSESLFPSQKTSKSLEKPMSEFQTLIFCVYWLTF